MRWPARPTSVIGTQRTLKPSGSSSARMTSADLLDAFEIERAAVDVDERLEQLDGSAASPLRRCHHPLLRRRKRRGTRRSGKAHQNRQRESAPSLRKRHYFPPTCTWPPGSRRGPSSRTTRRRSKDTTRKSDPSPASCPRGCRRSIARSPSPISYSTEAFNRMLAGMQSSSPQFGDLVETLRMQSRAPRAGSSVRLALALLRGITKADSGLNWSMVGSPSTARLVVEHLRVARVERQPTRRTAAGSASRSRRHRCFRSRC